VLELVGHTGGASQALALRGHHVYLGVGLRLEVIDVSLPSAPRSLAQSAPLPGVITSVALADEHALVLTEGSGLYVLNVSDPRQLRLVGALKLAQPAGGLAVSEGYAYVATGDAGLAIIDVTMPETPRYVGAFRTRWAANSVTVANQFVYVAEGNRSDWSRGAFEVIDVSDPTAPRLAGSLDTPFAHAVAVAGGYAVVAASTYSLIADVSEPSHLRLIGSYRGYASYDDVAVTGSYALISTDLYCDVVAVCPRQVEVLDISNPAQPRLLDNRGLPRDLAGAGRGMVIQDGLVYLANEVGLQILKGPPWRTVGEYRTVSRVGDVAVANDVAYGVDLDQTLYVFDVEDPTTPQVVGAFSNVPGAPARLYLIDGYAVVEVVYWRLAIVNVRQVQQPRLATQIEIGVLSSAIRGTHLYVAHDVRGGWRLSIYDIGDLASPWKVSSIPIQGGDYIRIGLADHYALLLNAHDAVEIVDIANVKSPRKVGELALDPPEKASYPAMAVKWPYVYLLRQSVITPFPVELLVFEFAAPAELRPITALTLSRGGRELTVASHYIYVVGSDGVSVVDISDPVQPREVGNSNVGGEKIVAEGDYLYIAGWKAGLLILRVSPIEPGGS